MAGCAGAKVGEFTYAADLKADFTTGIYEFRDADGAIPRLLYSTCTGRAIGSVTVSEKDSCVLSA